MISFPEIRCAHGKNWNNNKKIPVEILCFFIFILLLFVCLFRFFIIIIIFHCCHRIIVDLIGHEDELLGSAPDHKNGKLELSIRDSIYFYFSGVFFSLSLSLSLSLSIQPSPFYHSLYLTLGNYMTAFCYSLKRRMNVWTRGES